MELGQIAPLQRFLKMKTSAYGAEAGWAFFLALDLCLDASCQA